jgi:hypothetical protein
VIMESIAWTVIDLLFDLPRILVRHLGKRVKQLPGVTRTVERGEKNITLAVMNKVRRH